MEHNPPPFARAHFVWRPHECVCLCLRACMRTSVSMPACVPMSVCMSFVQGVVISAAWNYAFACTGFCGPRRRRCMGPRVAPDRAARPFPGVNEALVGVTGGCDLLDEAGDLVCFGTFSLTDPKSASPRWP